jgi:hypothetical protein
VNRYKVNFIKNSLKALAASSKVAIRIAESGVMNIQFLIPIPEMSKLAFVEFYVRFFLKFDFQNLNNLRILKALVQPASYFNLF